MWNPVILVHFTPILLMRRTQGYYITYPNWTTVLAHDLLNTGKEHEHWNVQFLWTWNGLWQILFGKEKERCDNTEQKEWVEDLMTSKKDRESRCFRKKDQTPFAESLRGGRCGFHFCGEGGRHPAADLGEGMA